MMWKTLIFLAVISIVSARRIKKHETQYQFHVKHDYDYRHHKAEHHDHEKKEEQKEHLEEKAEEQPQEENNQEVEQNQEQEVQTEEKKEEENQEQGEQSNNESHEHEDHDKHGFSAYEILYKVEDPYTHDFKGLHEKKYDDEVKGAYWLIQPDGYKRTVNYHADKHSGFNANVDYSKHEDHHEEESNSEQDNGEDSKKHEDKSDHHTVAKSEYFVSIQHGLKKPTPIKEENQEQENQESSAEHFPIYVI